MKQIKVMTRKTDTDHLIHFSSLIICIVIRWFQLDGLCVIDNCHGNITLPAVDFSPEIDHYGMRE